ncbi:hypothetical protein CBL_10722 [Carabus blaptoides fortunei]
MFATFDKIAEIPCGYKCNDATVKIAPSVKSPLFGYAHDVFPPPFSTTPPAAPELSVVSVSSSCTLIVTVTCLKRRAGGQRRQWRTAGVYHTATASDDNDGRHYPVLIMQSITIRAFAVDPSAGSVRPSTATPYTLHCYAMHPNHPVSATHWNNTLEPDIGYRCFYKPDLRQISPAMLETWCALSLWMGGVEWVLYYTSPDELRSGIGQVMLLVMT